MTTVHLLESSLKTDLSFLNIIILQQVIQMIHIQHVIQLHTVTSCIEKIKILQRVYKS